MQPNDKSPFPGYATRWQVAHIESTAPLPRHVKTIDKKIRIPVDLDVMSIQGDDGVKRKLMLRRSLLAADEDLLKASCAVIVHALDGRRKTSVVVGWTSGFSLFLRTIQSENLNRRTNTVTLAMYNWYATKKNASQFKVLRGFLLYWSSLDVPGLASDLRTFLADSALPKTPSPIEVQNRSPKERPLSNESVRRLLDKIGELYAAGQFDEQ